MLSSLGGPNAPLVLHTYQAVVKSFNVGLEDRGRLSSPTRDSLPPMRVLMSIPMSKLGLTLVDNTGALRYHMAPGLWTGTILLCSELQRELF